LNSERFGVFDLLVEKKTKLRNLYTSLVKNLSGLEAYVSYPIKNELNQMKKNIIVLFLILLSFCNQTSNSNPPSVKKGVLDLRSLTSLGKVNLDGDWEFYWNCQLASNPQSCVSRENKYFAQVPGIWNGLVIDGKEISGQGYASYRILLYLKETDTPISIRFLDAATSYNLWVNGKLILSNGRAGTDKESTEPRFLPITKELTNLKQENEIIVEISNFHHYKGGFWESVTIGDSEDLKIHRENKVWMDVFLSGSISIMLVYHIGLYILRRKDISSIHFALFCFVVMLRLLVTGERLLFYKFPNFNWELGNKIEYGTLYLVIPTFAAFIMSIFPNEFSNLFKKIFISISLVLVALLFVTDISVYSYTALPWEIFIILVCIYGLYCLVLSVIHNRDGALASLVGFLFLISTVINDILYANTVINTAYLLPYGLFLFIFAQSFLISLRFSKAFLSVELLSENLQKTNEAYSRFVPTEFLSVLNKTSIIDVKLGDQIQREMTVMFSDIRGFTSLSESMTPQENFNFINSYLKVMEPIISNHNGFIDKYIGDSIMALFPESAEHALNASISMLRELRIYNEERIRKNLSPIKIGIGLNTGNLMLGTIGGKNRMDGTVISDSVNLASRLESLTKTLYIPILISETVYNHLQNKEQFSIREIDTVFVRGKSKPIVIYECFDADEEQVRICKKKNLENFSKGLIAFRENQFQKAKEYFIECEKKCPEDSIAFIYINRCNEKLA